MGCLNNNVAEIELDYNFDCFQNEWSLLHSAARGGNVDLVDWLSETFDLDVHQRTKVMLD